MIWTKYIMGFVKQNLFLYLGNKNLFFFWKEAGNGNWTRYMSNELNFLFVFGDRLLVVAKDRDFSEKVKS